MLLEARQQSLEDVISVYDNLHLSGLRTREERLRQLKQALSLHLSLPAHDLTRADIQSAVDTKAAEGRKA